MFEKIKSIYPSLTNWEHLTLAKPTEEQLA